MNEDLRSHYINSEATFPKFSQSQVLRPTVDSCCCVRIFVLHFSTWKLGQVSGEESCHLHAIPLLQLSLENVLLLRHHLHG